MIPLGYMWKLIPTERPDWIKAPAVRDVYSVSDCVNDNIEDAASVWRRNGYSFFNAPEDLMSMISADGIRIRGALLFYYEAYELEFDGQGWCRFKPDECSETSVLVPERKRLEGFDVVAFCDGPNSHSPLSCNGVAADVRTNDHCLFATEEDALTSLAAGLFADSEPGPYRIYAVYTVDWV